MRMLHSYAPGQEHLGWMVFSSPGQQEGVMLLEAQVQTGWDGY